MKRFIDNMWLFALLLLLFSMSLSTAVYFMYMRPHVS
jgi:hypothetical protein